MSMEAKYRVQFNDYEFCIVTGSYPVKYYTNGNILINAMLCDIVTCNDYFRNLEIFIHNCWRSVKSFSPVVADLEVSFTVEIKVKDCPKESISSYNSSWIHGLIMESIIEAELENRIDVKVKQP